jgi:hypothetical protein
MAVKRPRCRFIVSGGLRPSITVRYNGLVEASKPGYNKGYLGPYLTDHYNGKVEAYMQGYSKDSLCPL